MIHKDIGSLLEEITQTYETWKDYDPSSPQLSKLEELIEDVKSDYFTFVVVGEFKNGKSTFLNALIEQTLLPVNVTPTTAAIHVLHNSESQEVEVIHKDGHHEFFPLTRKALDKFTAKADFDIHALDYIRVPVGPPFLKEQRVVLVDTPGVNDLNEHRVEVTHKFVPRADGVLFMVDIHSPFSKSELEFLNEYVLKYGSDHILFVVNFIDQLDDEDEIADSIAFANRRLSAYTGKSDHNILPLSALEALEGVEEKDIALYQMSGMVEVTEAMKDLIDNGSKQKKKMKRYEARYDHICFSISQEINQMKVMTSHTLEELEAERDRLSSWTQGKDVWGKELNAYIDERSKEISYMTMKSVDYFEERLKKDITEAVDYHHGGDIQNFVENQLSRKIKRDVTLWVEQRSPMIYDLFKKLEKEISEGLTDAFAKETRINNRGKQVKFDTVIDLDSPADTNPMFMSGILTGGTMGFALLLGAGVFAPVVAIIGAPWINHRLKKNAWEKAKPEIQEASEHHLSTIFNDLRNHLHTHISDIITHLKSEATKEFTRLLSHYQRQMDEEISKKNGSLEERKEEVERLDSFAEQLLQRPSHSEHRKEPVT